MLPAVKVFAVAALLGGGAIGTFALAGGFGSGGNGSGNGEATAQVAATTETAKPSSSVPAATTPKVTTPPEAGVARASGDGSIAVGTRVQQRGEVSNDGQNPQSVPQVNSQTKGATAGGKDTPESSSPRGTPEAAATETTGIKVEGSVSNGEDTRDAGSEEGQGVTENEKTNLELESVVNATSDANPKRAPGSSASGDSLAASATVQQESLGTNPGENGSLPASDSGNAADKAGNIGAGVAETRTASGEENTSST